MSEQENIRIVQDIFKNLNSQNLDANDNYYSQNVISRQPGMQEELKGRDQTKMFMKGYYRAFPDLRFTVSDIIAQGDLVSTSWVATGTHKGPLSISAERTIEATNRKFKDRGATVYEIKNGKVVRQEIYFDLASTLMQLGVLELSATR